MESNPQYKVQTVGAGVVPMSICPSTGVPHILLGQERYVRGWSGSLKVSGFEGGNKQGESPEQNAARECHEETLGLVYDTQQGCAEELVNGKFVMRIAIGSRTKTHVTYLTTVPWIDDIRSKFKELRSFLVELDVIASKFESVNRKIRVVLADEPQEEEGWTRPGLSKSTLAYAHSIRKTLEEKLQSSPHGTHTAITVTREDNVLKRVKVNHDYLEKIEMQYISVQSANDMLHRRRSIIRPFFRPVLAAICAHVLYETSPTGKTHGHDSPYHERLGYGWACATLTDNNLDITNRIPDAKDSDDSPGNDI
jgi:hypothetical protein